MTNHLSRGWLLGVSTLALVGLALACGKHGKSSDKSTRQPPPPPDAADSIDYHSCVSKPDKDCPVQSCGNTAEINDSIIEALDIRGLETQDLPGSFRLIRGSLVGAGGACSGTNEKLSLEVRDGAFVAVAGAPGGAAICKDAELVGARFTVEHAAGQHVAGAKETSERHEVRIADRREVALADGATMTAVTLPTYELTYTDKGKEEHLCDEKPWFRDASPKVLSDAWGKASFHAVLVQGEIYRKDGTVVDTNAYWFNIACAGSGIAKMRLLGLDPMTGSVEADRRQSMLKMITGRYCGAESWATDDSRILIRLSGDTEPPPGSEPIGPIESDWGPNGALCISHLRAWTPKSECAERFDEAAVVAHLRSVCGIDPCRESAPCAPMTTERGALWRTCTVGHVSHAPP
jgi:hypothetical protein